MQQKQIDRDLLLLIQLIGEANIKNLFFDILLLEKTDHRAMLFEIHLIQSEYCTDSVKNCIIRIDLHCPGKDGFHTVNKAAFSMFLYYYEKGENAIIS